MLVPLYRNHLPQLEGGVFLTDGGLETTLIFHQGIDLPHFASYALLETPRGRAALDRYFEEYLAVAEERKLGFVLESIGWRANPDWAAKLDHAPARLAELQRESIAMLVDLRDRYAHRVDPMVISGCIGPRGDGYQPKEIMSELEAQRYHGPQMEIYASTEADFVSAMTITNVPEAIGIVRAAERAKMPVVISFTVETDGKLPSGDTLEEGIERVDASCAARPGYFMINCAYPTHFQSILAPGASWTKRIGGLRANSSCKSHAELNESTELDMGNPAELGKEYRELLRLHPQLRVLGGCCGTDVRHVRAIAEACL